MIRSITTIGFLMTVLFFMGLSAHSALADQTDNRQLMQRARIAEGVANGKLDETEARQLRRGQRHIRRAERRGADEEQLNRMQNRQSQRIYRKKHN